MIQYAINSIICSGLLFFLYKALLEKEKMHQFKRFYLLVAIVVSLTAPLVTFHFSTTTEASFIQVVSREPAQLVIEPYVDNTIKGTNNLEIGLWLIYITIMVLGWFRLVKNIRYLLNTQKHTAPIPFSEAKLILMEQTVNPHSFLKTIFLNKKEYLEGRVENEVLIHELTHVRQYHSIDVLFVQIIQCFVWFNPFLHFYKKSIQLNHEFIADEAAACSSDEPLLYQQLLLARASGKQSFSLASQFNYSIIKKRLVMITKNTSHRISWLKKLTILPLIIITAFLFAKKETSAQKTEPAKVATEVPSSNQNASQQLVEEYEAIVDKYKKITPKGNVEYLDMPDKEQERLLSIYQQMTKEQQDKQIVGFRAKSPVKAKSQPTESQLKEWTDASKYFVRINGYKIKNDVLKDHRASDFDYMEIYKPNKGSTDYGKYTGQVNLMTKEAYARYVQAWEKQAPFLLVVFVNRKK